MSEETLDSSSPSSNSAFQCSICLDLLYKPVVLACGHMSCFWCVHKAMDGARASSCPICRRSYSHFPGICQLLHFLLLKIYHEAYKMREKEVVEEERRDDCFSPQFSDHLVSQEVHQDVDKSENYLNLDGNIDSEVISSKNGLESERHWKISVDDVACSTCKEILFRPIVLNCGHVYCKSCLSDGPNDQIKCRVCECLHYGEFPNVCFDLDHFMEETFPSDYAMRREKVQLEEAQCQSADPSSSASLLKANKDHEAIKDGHKQSDAYLPNAHIGIGCDSCGMYPIIGKRFRCKDCKEKVGFDLCETCYNTTSKLPGRFNQQHTPDHTFELDETMLYSRLLVSWLSLPLEEIISVEEDFDGDVPPPRRYSRDEAL